MPGGHQVVRGEHQGLGSRPSLDVLRPSLDVLRPSLLDVLRRRPFSSKGRLVRATAPHGDVAMPRASAAGARASHESTESIQYSSLERITWN